MRSLFLTAALLSTAFADEAAPPPPASSPARVDAPLAAYAPVRAIGVMVATHQALFWDDVVHEFRLAKIGEDVEGWRLISVEATQVVVEQAGVRDTLGLSSSDELAIAPEAAEPVETTAQPVQPIVQRLPPVVVPPPRAADVTHLDKVVARTALDRELGDFNRLMAGLDVASADGGGFTITRLDAASWVATLGLAQGDVVRSVAGERVSSVDDASRVYARLANMTEFVIEADRKASSTTTKLIIHVTIQ
jgi:hypothetical protein